MDKTQLIENAQRQLARRQASLQATLDEIATLEAIQAQGVDVSAAIAAARTKRDRQHNAALASEQLITALNTAAPTKKGGR